jgi:DNA gyrase subunit A
MEIGLVRQIDINAEMRQSYLSYAMSVIVSRALPDVRDGLKPVQRRILYAMYDMGLWPDRPYRKSARVVGEVLGKYHPHGDQSVYDAMVRLAQDFSMRYPLVDGQGNFGSIDGDGAAAMRYTEARMTRLGFDLLEDIGKETVDFVPNFDESMMEPAVLPSILPNLLINGSSGIAVGLSTSIPPHNLGEVIDGLTFLLDNWKHYDHVTVSDLMRYIQGPDFPTGGLVYRYRGNGEADALRNAYATGRGQISVRAKAHVEQMERNKSRIVITELPYQVNKTNLLSKIADLHREGRLEGLTDMRDESDRNGMRIILETTRTVSPKELLAELFRLTPMQSTFSIIMVALVNGEPRALTLKQVLRFYLDHRLEVTERRAKYDLMKARERAHILEGLLIALDNLDAVIETIRHSRNAETARTNLMREFKLTELQAQAILDMQLRRLAALEQKNIRTEYQEKLKLIARLEELLASPELMRRAIRDELSEIKKKYADLRRTQIVDQADAEPVTATDLLPDEQVWVVMGEQGTLSRTPTTELPQMPAGPGETPKALLAANTQDILYLFVADGRAISLPVYQLPIARELGKGVHLADMTALTRRDHVATALILPDSAGGYLFLATVGGVVKRVRMEDLPGIVTEPFTVINVPEDDTLCSVAHTSGNDEIILVSRTGQAIRFLEEEVRPMGLAAGGMKGIRLNDSDDGVIALELARAGTLLWSITDNGLAKATPIDQYPLQGRYGQGVINLRLPAGAEEVAAAIVGPENMEIAICTTRKELFKSRIDQSIVGSRSIKARPLLKLGQRARVSRVLALAKWKSPEELAGKQLTLLD